MESSSSSSSSSSTLPPAHPPSTTLPPVPSCVDAFDKQRHPDCYLQIGEERVGVHMGVISGNSYFDRLFSREWAPGTARAADGKPIFKLDLEEKGTMEHAKLLLAHLYIGADSLPTSVCPLCARVEDVSVLMEMESLTRYWLCEDMNSHFLASAFSPVQAKHYVVLFDRLLIEFAESRDREPSAIRLMLQLVSLIEALSRAPSTAADIAAFHRDSAFHLAGLMFGFVFPWVDTPALKQMGLTYKPDARSAIISCGGKAFAKMYSLKGQTSATMFGSNPETWMRVRHAIVHNGQRVEWDVTMSSVNSNQLFMTIKGRSQTIVLHAESLLRTLIVVWAKWPNVAGYKPVVTSRLGNLPSAAVQNGVYFHFTAGLLGEEYTLTMQWTLNSEAQGPCDWYVSLFTLHVIDLWNKLAGIEAEPVQSEEAETKKRKAIAIV